MAESSRPEPTPNCWRNPATTGGSTICSLTGWLTNRRKQRPSPTSSERNACRPCSMCDARFVMEFEKRQLAHGRGNGTFYTVYNSQATDRVARYVPPRSRKQPRARRARRGTGVTIHQDRVLAFLSLLSCWERRTRQRQ